MKKKLGIFILALIGMLSLTSCGNSKLYESTKKGYRNINMIEGITFDVPESLINNSTAITSITKDSQFEESQTYLYKDGKEQYFIFNMDNMIIAVQKNTAFNLKLDNLELIQSSNILGIWFDKDGRKLEMEGNQEKILSKVKGDVAITTEMYGEFYGNLAIVQSENQQWALFAGLAADSLDSDKQDTIDHIAKSLTLTSNSQGITLTPSIDTEEVFETELESKSELELESIDSIAVESTIQESEIVFTEENTEESISEIISTIEEELFTEDIEVIETEIFNEEIIGSTEDTENNEEKSSAQDNVKSETATEVGMSLNNQNNIDIQSDKAYLSDIYSLMPIGTWTILSTYTTMNNEILTGRIQITDIIQSAEAKQFLINNGIHDTAPTGCEWHVAEYITDIDPKEGYINIKLRGIDGENLRYRGIEYSKKTHDITYMTVDDGKFYKRLYIYYAVPKGCKQYVLECGDGDITQGLELYSGYYIVDIE